MRRFRAVPGMLTVTAGLQAFLTPAVEHPLLDVARAQPDVAKGRQVR